ncbi:MAG: PD-(D/E)XK nuclease family protein, partial [Solirubrobacteraceae bacterium]
AQAAGFASAAGDLIAELQRSLVPPQRFAAALGEWAAFDPRRASHGRDVSSLYLAYMGELDRIGRMDTDLYAWRALDALRAEPACWGVAPAFFYGFDDLHVLQRDAVETLARVVGVDVMVSLTYEPARAALTARAPAVEELRSFAERVVVLPAVDDYYEPASRTVLHHLERGLFEPAQARIDPGPAVALLEAGGERSEAELVAAEVLTLLRAGVPGHEIVVVFRSLTRAAPVVEHVFGRYGIATAHASSHGVTFASTALGRGVLALARCALLEEGQARAEDLLAYLRSPGVLERLEVADALEVQVRREGLRTAADAHRRLGWRLPEIDALRSAADLTGELARQARRLFAAPYQPDDSRAAHRRDSAPALGPREELDGRALAVLLRALSELEEIADIASGSEEVADIASEEVTDIASGPDEVTDAPSGPELIDLLAGLQVHGAPSTQPQAVLLAEPLQIRARRFRAVFICGLQEGDFPLPGTPEPFLSDERRRELAQASGLALAPREDALARERYLFYACFSRGTERVTLSYRSSDEEGNLALASPFLTDVADLLVEDWRGRRRRRLLADVVWAPDSAPTPSELARAHAVDREPAAEAVYGPARGPAPESPRPAPEPTPVVRTLGAAALRHVRHVEILSAGGLEAYADCPVKWLVERELRPARFDPEPDALARGSYMHSVLEELLRRLARPVTPKSLPDANRILDDLLAGPPRAVGLAIAPGHPPAVRTAALRTIEADLRRYLAHEAASGCRWTPEGIELRFGFPSDDASLPALELGEGSERLLVRGAIDRVDVAPADGRRRGHGGPDHDEGGPGRDRPAESGADANGGGPVERGGAAQAIVRDYKSGSTRPEHQGARWRPERRLQVALYMIAVRDLLGLEPVGGLYQPLGGGDLRARGIFRGDAAVGTRTVATDERSAQELDAELEGAAARAISLAARLRAGELTPCPRTCSRDGCRHPGICRAG